CNELEKKIEELERVERHQEEIAFDASNSQIELAARETRINQLAGEVQALKQRLETALAENRSLAAELGAAKSGSASRGGRVRDSETRIVQLTAALADAEERLARREQELARPPDSADLREQVERLTAEKAAQEERLRKLTEKNRRMRAAATPGGEAADGNDREALRAQISALAAELVHLTEVLEGPQSPIRNIIRPARNPDNPPSIADRVRALREAAEKT